MNRIIPYIHQTLRGLYPESEIRAFMPLIFESVCGWNRTRFLINKNTTLSDKERNEVLLIVQRLKKYEPLQYILGETIFYGLSFEVNPSTLIPRPETEELVDWIIHVHKNTSGCLLDIGTGSGCIAVSLAKHLPDYKVSALDVSAQALSVAHRNAERNHVHVEFLKKDILTSVCLEGHFDIIVSNPPYVLEREKPEISPNVLEHEPHTALFVSDADPLVFYRHIAAFAARHLKENGMLYVEINQALGKETVRLFREAGFSETELKKDLHGNDRMIRACRKN